MNKIKENYNINTNKDYYKILNINNNIKTEEIKYSYENFLERNPSEININSQRIKDILEAYNILSNENTRQQYIHNKEICTSPRRFGFG